jgi:hypothetical protein
MKNLSLAAGFPLHPAAGFFHALNPFQKPAAVTHTRHKGKEAGMVTE